MIPEIEDRKLESGILRADLAAVAAITCLTVLFFWEPIFAGRILLLRDLHALFQPWKAFAADAIRSGVVPLWNHYSYCGMPFLANPEAAVFYPPSALFCVLPFPMALHLHVIGHTLFLAVGGYVLMRYFSFTAIPSLLTAVAVAFGAGPLRAQEFLSVHAALAWYPWVLMAWWQACERPTCATALAAGVVSALQTLSGGLQVEVYSLIMVAGVWAFWVMRSLGPAQRGRVLKRLLWPAIAAILPASLCAVQLVPTLEFAAESHRASVAAAEQTAPQFGLRWGELVLLGFPYLAGYPDWTRACYVGIPALLVSPWALLWLRRRREDQVLGDRRSAVVLLSLAFVVIGLALATDRPAPLSQFLYEHAPLWRSLVRWRSMGIVLCSFSVCLLAGAGLEWLMSRGKTSGRWPLVASMVLACLIGGLVLVDTAYGLQVGRALQNYLRPKTGAELNSLLLPERYDLMGQYGWALLWTIAAAVLIACRGRHGMPAWSLGLALIVLLALDLFAFGWRQNYYSARNVYETRPATVDRVIRETPGDRILVTKATELAILCSYGSRDDGVFLYLRDACAEETSLPYRVFKTEGWLSAPTKRWSEFSSLTRSFRSTQREQVERLTGLLGASYLITPEAPWRLGEPPPRVLVVPVPRRLPRFFAVSRVVTASAAEAPRLMTADGFDASREAVLEAGAVPLDATGQGLVGSMRYELNRITAAVEDARHGYLVSTDAYYPGWDCFVGGRRVTMERADIVFRAIPVGTGSQPLDLVYRPASFLLGVWITLAGVAASMAAAGWWGATRWR